MAEKLKNLFFSRSFLDRLASGIQELDRSFDQEGFLSLVHNGAWEAKELKARLRHVAICLHETLPQSYPQALAILSDVAPSFQGFDAMVFPEYVGCFGLQHWDLSLPALAFFTRFASSEFAIRPFLVQDPERALAAMSAWAEDENHHVRRLASEGCRPRLPWAMALPAFKRDPAPILPILEKLKDDVSEYVRKSVANNLNDISKDHPDLVLEICERWQGHTKRTDWIARRACRSLLKAGDPRALVLFGFTDPAEINVTNLALDRDTLPIGESLHFAFDLLVETGERCKIRLELGVCYRKARGKLSRKVFHIAEGSYEPGSHRISRRHSFQDLSTRKHYPGEHHLSIIVNGMEKAKARFCLVERSASRSA